MGYEIICCPGIGFVYEKENSFKKYGFLIGFDFAIKWDGDTNNNKWKVENSKYTINGNKIIKEKIGLEFNFGKRNRNII